MRRSKEEEEGARKSRAAAASHSKLTREFPFSIVPGVQKNSKKGFQI